MYLYVLKDIRHKSRWVKVGRTANPLVRLSHYNSSFPEDTIFYSYLSQKLVDSAKAELELVEELKDRLNPNITNKSKLIKQKKAEWFEAPGKSDTALSNFIEDIIFKIKILELKFKS